MEKIKTIFDRDWSGNKKVIDKYIDSFDPYMLGFIGDENEYVSPDGSYKVRVIATEKVDGTNVRLTVRKHTLVRVEKRKNPSKIEKEYGITDPWYVDADIKSSEDKHIWAAALQTDLSMIDDGEWSGEAIGPNIQGNPLKLEDPTVILFSNPLVRETLEIKNVPITFNQLKEWLPNQSSIFNPEVKIEGIVWHRIDLYNDNVSMYKIKIKDFRY